jgi:hypothetical protein
MIVIYLKDINKIYILYIFFIIKIIFRIEYFFELQLYVTIIQ